MSEDTGDPRTADDDAWGELTDDILALGDRLLESYRQAADGDGPSEAEIRQALSTLGQAWNQMAGAVGVAIQDPEVRRHLKRAAGSLAGAVATTLEEFVPRTPPDGMPPEPEAGEA